MNESATGGMQQPHPHALANKSASFSLNKTPSFMGFGKVAQAGVKNIAKIKIKRKSERNLLAAEFHYKPKVSQTFLQDWLDYPVDRHVHSFFNSFVMWIVYLQWTNKGMAGLDPLDSTIRSRVCNQLQVLGTVASLFLVIAVASFLVPPEPKSDREEVWLNIFGCLMFTASVSLILYIALALTAIYPLVESLRDDIAFDAFENYQRHLGGKETYLFFIGLILVLVAMLVGARILYTDVALYTMIGITIVIGGFAQYLGRLVFISLDPISSMHLGLTNNPDEHNRAELLSHFILRKIPNTLIIDEKTGRECFLRKRESEKLELTRSQKLQAAKRPGGRPAQGAGARANYFSSRIAASAVVPAEDDDGESVGFETRVSVDSGNTAAANDAIKEDDAMTVVDMDGAVMPFVPVSVSTGANAAPRMHTRANKVEAARVEVVQKFSAHKGPLPPLQEMFCHPDKYLFREAGLSLVDSVAVYAFVTQVGCVTTEKFIAFLKEFKQYRPCTCTHSSNGDAGSASHADQCSSRRARVWAETLVDLGVPSYHAMLVIQTLRSHL